MYELDTLAADTVDVTNAAARFAQGDVFAREVARIGPQRFSALERPTPTVPFELSPPYELQPRSEPRRRSRRDLLWSREHGAAKRLAVICELLVKGGWNAHVAAADFHAPADAPLLTEDAAIMLLCARRDHTMPCTRDDIRNAFAFLMSPRVAAAVWVDG